MIASLSALEDDGLSMQEAYNVALESFQKREWNQLKSQSKQAIEAFPASPFLSDLYYYVGVAYFSQHDYEMANFYFSQFLEKYATPKYFEEAVVYKYLIAEQFQKGERKHLMGVEAMPRIVSAWDDAYAIYDEVIATLPRHEVAAKALFNKAEMKIEEGDSKEAIELYQTMIRRFPKHNLTPKAYLAIAKSFLQESQGNFPDKEFLEQAQLNYRKFRAEFPGEDRLVDAEAMLAQMQDRYARDLWESANYYDKKQKFQSSFLYYLSIVRNYPESKYAHLALQRVSEIKIHHPDKVKEVLSLEIANG